MLLNPITDPSIDPTRHAPLVPMLAVDGSDMIKWCLYSITDNHSFLRSNRQPIDDTLALLRKFFKPTAVEDGYNLAITSGVEGARLTHDHERHYRFVEQSLSLWQEVRTVHALPSP